MRVEYPTFMSYGAENGEYEMKGTLSIFDILNAWQRDARDPLIGNTTFSCVLTLIRCQSSELTTPTIQKNFEGLQKTHFLISRFFEPRAMVKNDVLNFDTQSLDQIFFSLLGTYKIQNISTFSNFFIFSSLFLFVLQLQNFFFWKLIGGRGAQD